MPLPAARRVCPCRRSGRQSAFRAACLLAALACCPPSAANLRAQTLRSLLSPGLPADSGVLPNLDREVSNGAVLSDGKWFAVAYYLASNSGALSGALFVDRYDRTLRQWRSAALPPEKVQAGPSDCAGPTESLKAIADSFVLQTRLDPGAACTLVLSQDLELRAAFYGWPLAVFADGSIVFQRSMTRFAPVHPAGLDFYNRKTGHIYSLFPRKPYGQLRRAVSARLAAFFDSHLDWCNQHNHPCDPDNPDSRLVGQPAVNDQTDSLAFLIEYGGDPQDPDSPPVPGARARAAYIFRNVHSEFALQWREMPESEAESKLAPPSPASPRRGAGKSPWPAAGANPLAYLLAPPSLQSIFGN